VTYQNIETKVSEKAFHLYNVLRGAMAAKGDSPCFSAGA
jgi:hypothetical protein